MGPVTPASVTPTNVIPINDTYTNCTPGAPNLTGSVSASHSIGTIATATATGSIAATLGANLGIDELSAVSASGTLTLTGSWSWALNNTWTKTWTPNYNVPACQTETLVCTIKQWGSAAFSESGGLDWTANVNTAPTWAWPANWVPGAGSCGPTTASGNATTDALSPGVVVATFGSCSGCGGG
jgi:hypothetical protein